MLLKLLSDRVSFHYCNGLIRRVLCLAFVLGIFAGAPPAHAAPPAPDPRFGAVEAHMLPDAAASLRPGWTGCVLTGARASPQAQRTGKHRPMSNCICSAPP